MALVSVTFPFDEIYDTVDALKFGTISIDFLTDRVVLKSRTESRTIRITPTHNYSISSITGIDVGASQLRKQLEDCKTRAIAANIILINIKLTITSESNLIMEFIGDV